MNNDPSLSIDRLHELLHKETIGSRFFQCELHQHTPYSHDYMVNGRTFLCVGITELEEEAASIGLSGVIIPVVEEKEKQYKYRLGCLLLADTLRRSSVEVVAITDHETVAGYWGMKSAFRAIRKRFPNMRDVRLLPGVEINTMEGAHIIGIVERKNADKLSAYLDVVNYYRVKRQPLSLNQIRQEFTELQAVVYFPHITTLDAGDNIKNEIYGSRHTNAVGVKRGEEKLERDFEIIISKKVQQCTDQAKDRIGERVFPVSVIVDSDAHCVEDVGILPLWLKLSSPTALSIKYALRQPDRIRREKPESNSAHQILGLATFECPLGERKKWHFLRFSGNMNCIIGERGTGKSTILRLVNMLMTGKIEGVDDINLFRRWIDTVFYRAVLFVADNSTVYAYEYLNSRPMSVDPYRRIYAPNAEETKWNAQVAHLVNCYYKKDADPFFSQRSPNGRKLFKDRFNGVFLGQTQVERLGNSPEELYRLLIGLSSAAPEELNLSNVIIALEDIRIELREAFSHLSIYTECDPEPMLKLKQRWIDAIQKLHKVEFAIQVELNRILRGELKVQFEQVETHIDNEKFELLCRAVHDSSVLGEYAMSLLKKNLLRDFVPSAIDFFLLEPMQLVEKYSDIIGMDLEHDSLGTCTGFTAVQVAEKMKAIALRIHRGAGCTLASVVYVYGSLSLSVPTSKKHRMPRTLQTRSLGQRCVAVMDLIMASMEIFKTPGPFISDQPEDHQDNRYIFEHLTQKLRKMKAHNQIIITTHNPNIPVGSDAELITLMQGDGERFWSDKRGALDFERDNISIHREVQRILEGGENALHKRLRTYGLME